MDLIYELINTNSSFGSVGLNKLIRKIHGIYNTCFNFIASLFVLFVFTNLTRVTILFFISPLRLNFKLKYNYCIPNDKAQNDYTIVQVTLFSNF